MCEDCGGRFTTFERVQLREIFVVKRSGRRVPFDREKLSRSVEVALRKRPIQPERVERLVSGLVRQLESMGEQDVPSSAIGELVMEALKGLDPVAYVRFASVYRVFREAADFQEVLGEIAGASRRAASEPAAAQAARPRRAGRTESTEPRWPSRRALIPRQHARRIAGSWSWRCTWRTRILGQTAPNPAVGAVIADEATGEVIARGWTQIERPAARGGARAGSCAASARAARPCTSRWSPAPTTAARIR